MPNNVKVSEFYIYYYYFIIIIYHHRVSLPLPPNSLIQYRCGMRIQGAFSRIPEKKIRMAVGGKKRRLDFRAFEIGGVGGPVYYLRAAAARRVHFTYRLRAKMAAGPSDQVTSIVLQVLVVFFFCIFFHCLRARPTTTPTVCRVVITDVRNFVVHIRQVYYYYCYIVTIRFQYVGSVWYSGNNTF